MTRTTKTLALSSLACFGVGLTGMHGAIGLPFGAICFGLSMISKVMEKEAARFDEEHRARVVHDEQNQPSINPGAVGHIAEDQREPSFEAHFSAR
jgi:hypothetical protein